MILFMMLRSGFIRFNAAVDQRDDPPGPIDDALIVGGEDEGDVLLFVQSGHNVEQV